MLKWPNDILIDDAKVCGILIEVENDFLHAGIGCNVVAAPDVPSEGPDAGRIPTSIAEHLANDGIYSTSDKLSSTYHDIAYEIANAFRRWLSSEDSQSEVINDFQANMMLSSQHLRAPSGGKGDQVLPLYLNLDGTLRVRVMATGEEKTLIVDYLF
jgi:biotin-(acetyl-CoA carboxylase) ligase